MTDSTQKFSARVAGGPWPHTTLLGGAFAAILCIALVTFISVTLSYDWKLILIEALKVPLIVMMVWQAWKKEGPVQTTAIQFSMGAFVLSMGSDVVFVLAGR